MATRKLSRQKAGSKRKAKGGKARRARKAPSKPKARRKAPGRRAPGRELELAVEREQRALVQETEGALRGAGFRVARKSRRGGFGE